MREQFRQREKKKRKKPTKTSQTRCTVPFEQTVKLVMISQDTKLNADVNQWTEEGSKTPGLQCLPSTGGRLANLMKQGLPGQKQNARVHKMPQKKKKKKKGGAENTEKNTKENSM